MLPLNAIEKVMKKVCEDYMKGEDKMKITMEFIDRKGFWRLLTCEGKRKAIESLKALHPQTEIHWTKPNHVIVSQQYIKV